MLKPLNEYYIVRLIDEEKKSTILTINDETKKPIRKATVLARNEANELHLSLGNTVLIQQYYGQEIGDDLFLIKAEYIVAVDIPDA